MSATMLSPGVYLYEQDFSDYSKNTSTSIVGCVGEARRGPIGVPTYVRSQKELLEIFGDPTEGEYGIYSALQMLDNVTEMYYVRVVRSPTKATAGRAGRDKILYTALYTGSEYNGLKVEQQLNLDGTFNVLVYREVSESEPVYTYTVDSSVTADNFDDKVETGLYLKTGDTYTEISSNAVFNEDYTYYTRSESTPSFEPVILEKFENQSTNSADVNFLTYTLQTQSKLIRAEVHTSGTLTDKVFELSGAVDTGSLASAGSETDKLTFKSKYFDSTINGGRVIISEADGFGYFNVSLYDVSGTLTETFASVTLDNDDERYVYKVINETSKRITVEINEDDAVEFSGDTLTFTGGDDGIEGISDDDIIGEADGTGIQSLSNPELLTIDILTVPGHTSRAVINACTSLASSRGDCIFVLDTPFGLTVNQAISWANGTNEFSNLQALDNSYGAVYWPWCQIADNFTKKNIWLPPSGFIISKYAYNDIVAFPWVAPAGVVRGKITTAIGIEKSPTKAERDALYGNRNVINPIANFQSDGLVIWGQKTLQRKPTALDRVNVRRLLCYLKRTVGNALRAFVFEQNNSATWTELKTRINPILNNVKVLGGLYDYKISISPTAEEIENNTMPVYIWVKPTKSAEFIPVYFNVLAYSASMSDYT